MRRMPGKRRHAHHGNSVPIRLESGRELGTMSRGQTHPLPADDRRRAARLGRGGRGPLLVKASQLAHPPRVRVGEPGLAALDPVLRRPLPLPPLRRARLRDDRLGRRRPLVRALGWRPRGGGRRRRPRRAVRAARHLAGRRGLRRLRRPPSRARVAPDSLRRLRARLGAPRRPRAASASTTPSSSSSRAGWGKDNPAFRQVFTSRFIPGGTDEQIAWFNELCRKTTLGGRSRRELLPGARRRST